MIRVGLIDEVFDNIQNRITDSVSWINEYVLVGEVLLAAVVTLVVLALLGWFAPFTWIRQALSWIGSMIVAGTAGAILMWRHNRAESKRLRDQNAELKRKKHKNGDGWFS